MAIAPRGVFGGDEYDVSYVLFDNYVVSGFINSKHQVVGSSYNYVFSSSYNYVGSSDNYVASSSNNHVINHNLACCDAMPSIRQHGAGEQFHVHVCVQEYDVWPALCSETKTVAGSSGRGPILPVSSTTAAHRIEAPQLPRGRVRHGVQDVERLGPGGSN